MIGVSRRLRDAVFVLAIAIFSCALILATPLDRLRGLSIDILTMLRWRVFGSMHKPEQSPTIVVALDEETYRTPPFASTPAITWTSEIGQVLTAVRRRHQGGRLRYRISDFDRAIRDCVR